MYRAAELAVYAGYRTVPTKQLVPLWGCPTTLWHHFPWKLLEKQKAMREELFMFFIGYEKLSHISGPLREIYILLAC